MPTKNVVRADLNRLRKLCKNIKSIEYCHINSGTPLHGSPLEQQFDTLICNRDKLYDKYCGAVADLDDTEHLIFIFYYLQGLTQKTIAKKLNYCKSSITKHLSAIIEKLT